MPRFPRLSRTRARLGRQPAFVLALALSVVSGGCATIQTTSLQVQPEVPFALSVGQTAALAGTGTTLTLVSLADSRCPGDVTCVTAGDVVVVVASRSDGAVRSDTLMLRGTPRAVQLARQRVELVDVTPYPQSTDRDRRSRAALVFSPR